MWLTCDLQCKPMQRNSCKTILYLRCHMIMPLQNTPTHFIQFYNALVCYYKYLHYFNYFGFASYLVSQIVAWFLLGVAFGCAYLSIYVCVAKAMIPILKSVWNTRDCYTGASQLTPAYDHNVLVVVSCDKLHRLPQDGCMVHIWVCGQTLSL